MISSRQSKEFKFDARRLDDVIQYPKLVFCYATVGNTCKCSICSVSSSIFFLCYYMKIYNFIRIRETIDVSNFDHSKWNHVTDRFLYNQANIPWTFKLQTLVCSWSLKVKPGSVIHNFIHFSLQVKMTLQSANSTKQSLKWYHEQVKHSVLLIIRLINLFQEHFLCILSKCKTWHWKKPVKMF